MVRFGKWLSVIMVVTFIVICVFSSAAFAKNVEYKQNIGKEGFRLLKADQKHVHFTFSVSKVNIEDVIINGEPMQQVCIPGVILPRDFGMPNLPGRGQYIALPQGAR